MGPDAAGRRGGARHGGRRPASGGGIAVSSQGISFVLLDAQGLPLGNAINWLDGRATAECDGDPGARHRAESCSRLPANGLRPFYVLPKLFGCATHTPAG